MVESVDIIGIKKDVEVVVAYVLQVIDKIFKYKKTIENIIEEYPEQKPFWGQFAGLDDEDAVIFTIVYPEKVVEILKVVNKKLIEIYKDIIPKEIENVVSNPSFKKTAKVSGILVHIGGLPKGYFETIREGLKPYKAIMAVNPASEEGTRVLYHGLEINAKKLYEALNSRSSPILPTTIVELIKEASIFHQINTMINPWSNLELFKQLPKYIAKFEDIKQGILCLEKEDFSKIPRYFERTISTNMDLFNPPKTPWGEYKITVRTIRMQHAVFLEYRTDLFIKGPYHRELANLFEAARTLKYKEFRKELAEFIERAHSHVEQEIMKEFSSWGVSNSITVEVIRRFRDFKDNIVSRLLES